ncbi:TPA: Lon protease family protein [Pasteurella multocida]|uniref:AAA family ATPase n=1 Tax=Pasteurella multocida TaxID=747 RepID=UPI002023784F|nr:Lon protease family protein [Pasteurella multocida]URH74755.1 Lon protease family protein [Pasteurella multocida]HDR1111904.1 Lon protease family protein [Pasteurella multocida]HDR1347659.1 Lon protease family protein [Pasteurella multocida]HDR1352965.1 Lon protease family protein [Pasteurella multocida]HDR1591647.1 Lon protease family protein [Pasteurella multocida]
MNPSFLAEKALSWQDLRPELQLTELPHSQLDFFALQQRASATVSQFLHNPHRHLCVLKSDEQGEYVHLLEQFVASQQQYDNKIHGVQYVIEQGDAFSFPRIVTEGAQNQNDNFAAKRKVASALYVDQFQLLGSIRIHPRSQEIQLNPGLVHQLNGGVLILGVGSLINQFDLWIRLKQLLLTHRFDWYSAHPFKDLPCDIPSYPLSLKVILLGNREELATLAELDADLYDLADYSEIESYYAIESAEQRMKWAEYVQSMASYHQLPQLTLDGLNKLYQLLVRESEDRAFVSISPLKLKAILSGSAILKQKDTNALLSAVDFEQFFQQKEIQQSFLKEHTYSDILHEQVYVATEGDIVGQINGLSVIEYPGTPMAFGEPSRISCIVQFGDGEVVDVERKSELAGNIHGKSIMIAQACLAHTLGFPSQLPFSASLVFEQSYGEIDGDSASLASFCVLASALADYPLPQSIAITGAIDQFGLVHSVGGVNAKIEGFFSICARRGLTGQQGVMVPSTVIHQLSLSEDVVNAVKAGQFFIYPVEDVYQACHILFQRDLVEETGKVYSEVDLPLSRLIAIRIEQRAEQQLYKTSVWDWLLRKR